MVDARPLPSHGEEEVREVREGKGRRESGEERGETIDEIGLIFGLVRVPHAVEEGFPELFHFVVGN